MSSYLVSHNSFSFYWDIPPLQLLQTILGFWFSVSITSVHCFSFTFNATVLMVYNLVGVIWNIEYIAAFDNMTILWSVTACHGWNKDWLFPHFTKYHPNYSVWIMTTSMEGARNIWRCLIWIKITRNLQDVVSVERRPGRCDQWWHWLACCGPRVWQLTGVCGAPGRTAPRRRAPLLRRVLTTTTISLQNISRHHRDWRLLVQMSDCSQQHNVSEPASWWLVILHNEHSNQKQRRF